MDTFFHYTTAKKITLYSVALAIFMLVATPIRSTVVIALLMLYATAYLLVNRNGDKNKLTTEDWLVIAILIACFIGRFGPFVKADFSSRYISAGMHIAASIPIFLMLRKIIDDELLFSLRKYISISLGLGGVGAGIIAIWQTQVLGWKAADGFLFSINFGYMSSVVFALSLAFTVGKKHSYWLLAGIVGSLIAIVLSGSRGAFFPLPIIVFAWIVLNLKNVSRRRLLIAAIAVPAIALATYSSIPTIKERTDIGVSEIASFVQGDLKREGSFSLRVQLWVAAVEAAKKSPLIGLSYSEREALIQSLVKEEVLSPKIATFRRGHAHSQYFETLATGGVIGIVALFVYLFMPVILYCHYFLRDRHNIPAIAGMLFTLTYILCGLTEVLLQQEMIAAFYGFMQAVIILMARQHDHWHQSIMASTTSSVLTTNCGASREGSSD